MGALDEYRHSTAVYPAHGDWDSWVPKLMDLLKPLRPVSLSALSSLKDIKTCKRNSSKGARWYACIGHCVTYKVKLQQSVTQLLLSTSM